MKATITKIDNSGTEVVWEGDVRSLDEAFDIYTNAIIGRKADDYCLWQDYTRILDGHNKLYRDKCMGWLKKNGKISETFLTGKYSLELKVDIHDDWEEDDDWELFSESLDPEYGDKPENQYGEKWMRIQSTYLNGILDSIMKDIRVDSSDEDGPRMERMSLGDLHICEDGHLIAEIYGGANGGGLRGVESNWPFYLALVKKFLLKLLDYDNGGFFKDVWMVDWNNDCCDDVWTLTLGITLSDKEKLHLVEGNKFSVVDPTQLDVSLDAAVEMVNPLANDAIEIANAEATVAESRKRK